MAAADCFADQAVIVAVAVAGRCVEKIDSEIGEGNRAAPGAFLERRNVMFENLTQAQYEVVPSPVPP